MVAISLGSMTRRLVQPSILGLSKRSLYAVCALAVLFFDVPHSSAPKQSPVVVTKAPNFSHSSGVSVTLEGAGAPQGFTTALQNPQNAVRKLVARVSDPIVAANTGLPMASTTASTTFVLYSTAGLYASATAQYFGSSAATAAADTGGFTTGSTISIPIYKYQSTAALVNTTTHELTHAILNSAGIGSKLPTWINEGFAWYNGMQAERQIDPRAASELTQLLNTQLETARQKSLLGPLDAPVSQILRMDQTYNVEFVDYLAVKRLINEYGMGSFRHFLKDIPSYGVNLSFALNFHTPLPAYETSFSHSLM